MELQLIVQSDPVCINIRAYNVGGSSIPDWAWVLYPTGASEQMAGHQDWQTQHRDDGSERSESQSE